LAAICSAAEAIQNSLIEDAADPFSGPAAWKTSVVM
jgi:hypothetical protein